MALQSRNGKRLSPHANKPALLERNLIDGLDFWVINVQTQNYNDDKAFQEWISCDGEQEEGCQSWQDLFLCEHTVLLI
jgi:hypothetical protein